MVGKKWLFRERLRPLTIRNRNKERVVPISISMLRVMHPRP